MNYLEFQSACEAQTKSKELSDVKKKILKALWDSGETFPKPWVKSSYILNLTNQKYFDRRIRELRDEVGLDIETEHHNGEHCYRLKATALKDANPRSYLTEKEKKILFTAHRYECQTCGVKYNKGERGLQADHKVPLIRGGGHQTDNWQSLCNECNVAKRRACQGCSETCGNCPWAFPEKFGIVVTVGLDKNIYSALTKACGHNKGELSRTINMIVSKHLDET